MIKESITMLTSVFFCLKNGLHVALLKKKKTNQLASMATWNIF